MAKRQLHFRYKSKCWSADLVDIIHPSGEYWIYIHQFKSVSSNLDDGYFLTEYDLTLKETYCHWADRCPANVLVVSHKIHLRK